MAITTYAELQTAVGRWLQRTDLAAMIPDFIANAEAHFNRVLRLNGQLTRDNLTVSGRFTTLTFTAPLAEIRSVSCTSGGERWALEFATVNDMQNVFSSGRPLYYSRSGNELEVVPVPDGTYTLEVMYWRTIPDLATNNTNFLLTLAPDLYLYRAVMEGAQYVHDQALIARVSPMFDLALQQITRDDKARLFGGSAPQQRAM